MIELENSNKYSKRALTPFLLYTNGKTFGLWITFFCSVFYITLVSGATFNASEMLEELGRKGSTEMLHDLLGEGGSPLKGQRYDIAISFYDLLEAGEKETINFVEKVYEKSDNLFLEDSLARKWSRIALKYANNPLPILHFWKKAEMNPLCKYSLWHFDGERSLDITAPMAMVDFIHRKEKVEAIADKGPKDVINQCLVQIHELINEEVNWMKEEGFAFDEQNKFVRQAGVANDWIVIKKLLTPLEISQLRSQLRNPTDGRVWGLFDEIAYSGKPWGGDFQRRMAFYEKVASADKEWLLFVKERYADFDKFVYFNYKIPLYIMLGDAINNDAQAVLSIFKEEFSKDDELKNVCGNTYEDLLWGVAVEEQVIGAAVEKLEARKKSLTSMKDETLSAMKNQCIQAVDNSLAMWKGRAQ